MKDVVVDGGKRVFGCCASETQRHSPPTRCRLVSSRRSQKKVVLLRHKKGSIIQVLNMGSKRKEEKIFCATALKSQPQLSPSDCELTDGPVVCGQADGAANRSLD
ncbi:hypothetical protein MUK42_21089 [Musa troglodytarum]|uniref:Uncharacterized protein n=1 Tax=Musa troglodytarum TaxID=320322 RepID=A0A9E7KBV7_9LILI|nr:hypothetical protein MUK42_21089 [Musa troglodytarum]